MVYLRVGFSDEAEGLQGITSSTRWKLARKGLVRLVFESKAQRAKPKQAQNLNIHSRHVEQPAAMLQTRQPPTNALNVHSRSMRSRSCGQRSWDWLRLRFEVASVTPVKAALLPSLEEVPISQ